MFVSFIVDDVLLTTLICFLLSQYTQQYKHERLPLSEKSVMHTLSRLRLISPLPNSKLAELLLRINMLESTLSTHTIAKDFIPEIFHLLVDKKEVELSQLCLMKLLLRESKSEILLHILSLGHMLNTLPCQLPSFFQYPKELG